MPMDGRARLGAQQARGIPADQAFSSKIGILWPKAHVGQCVNFTAPHDIIRNDLMTARQTLERTSRSLRICRGM